MPTTIEKKGMKCPVCMGKGFIKEIPAGDKRYSDQMKHRMARILHEKGFSYRQIMKFTGYKSTRSISLALKAHNK